MIIRINENHEAIGFNENGEKHRHFSSLSVEFEVEKMTPELEKKLSKLRARLMLQTYRSATGMVRKPKDTIERFASFSVGPHISSKGDQE